MVRGKLLLMKMHLRTILQNAREATRLVVLEGGYKDFLNQLFIPDSHSLYWEPWGQVGGIPRQGGHLEVEGQLPGLTCWDILASLWTAHCRGEGPQKAHSGQPPPLLLGHSVRGCACWSCTAVQFCTTKHRMQTGQPHHSFLKTTPPNDGAASNSWHQHFPLRKESRHVGLMLLFLRSKEN